MPKYSRKKRYKVNTEYMLSVVFEFIVADEDIVVLRDREGTLHTYAHEYVHEIPPTPEEIAIELLKKQSGTWKNSFTAWNELLERHNIRLQYVEIKSNVP